MLVLALSALVLSPWNGSDLPTTTQSAAKYRLTVSGKPGHIVHLHTEHVATGWIAAFCDDKVCMPSQAAESIPKSGSVVLQFELIRETDDAPHRSGATIVADNGHSVVVPPASR